MCGSVREKKGGAQDEEGRQLALGTGWLVLTCISVVTRFGPPVSCQALCQAQWAFASLVDGLAPPAAHPTALVSTQRLHQGEDLASGSGTDISSRWFDVDLDASWDTASVAARSTIRPKSKQLRDPQLQARQRSQGSPGLSRKPNHGVSPSTAVRPAHSTIGMWRCGEGTAVLLNLGLA